jgi:enterochelin esterase-like enzyme
MLLTRLRIALLHLFGKTVFKKKISEQLSRYTFLSRTLRREVTVDVYQPPSGHLDPLRLFCFHDGQDLRVMPVEAIMHKLIAEEKSPPFLIVGIHANEKRMREYGTISTTDFAGRGDLALNHAHFVVKQLLPYLEKKYQLSPDPAHRSIAGFSLGGLSAFDLAWHYPHLFGTTGVFSGALWWRSKDYDPKDPDANRILHTQVAQDQKLPKLKYWFQAGTLDEKEDRNKNGIIDAIDDTLDLIKALELRGYHPQKDLHYHEVVGGKHHPKTWAKVLPDFLRWGLG